MSKLTCSVRGAVENPPIDNDSRSDPSSDRKKHKARETDGVLPKPQLRQRGGPCSVLDSDLPNRGPLALDQRTKIEILPAEIWREEHPGVHRINNSSNGNSDTFDLCLRNLPNKK